jgi:hypothetical protein
MKLKDLTTQLQSAYGDALRAVVLYGSAVAGEHIKKQSDFNVLIIVDHFPLDRVPQVSAVTRAWRAQGNPPPLVFTEHEWRTSADIFPMEYADILDRHHVLHGTPPFEGIVVDAGDLRLQVEHEALGVVFRLRQAILVAGSDSKARLELMGASLSTVMVVFRAILRLHSVAPPQNYAELARDTAEWAGFDPQPFYDIVHHVRGERSIANDRTGDVLAGYLRGIETAAAHVDGLPTTRN